MILEREVHPSAHVPTGYVRPVVKYVKGANGNDVPVHGPLEVDPVVGPHIARAFKLRAAGASWAEVGKYLDDSEVPRRTSKSWSPAAIRHIMSNPVYLGTAWTTFGGKRIEKPDAHPPLASRNLPPREPTADRQVLAPRPDH